MKTTTAVICLVVALVSGSAASHNARCPDGMVPATENVCIDEYEYPNIKGVPPTVALSATPEGNVVGNDLTFLCAQTGKRTCTRKEWVSACRGPDQSPYPYGAKPQKGACNTDKHWRPLSAAKIARWDEHELRHLDQSSPAGSFEQCVSPTGAYDMVGNAEEWVRCNAGEFGWCLVGGYWANAQSCSYSIVVHAPNWHYYQTSGRCCADMEN